MYETSQGFYITSDSISITDYEKTTVDPIVAEHLQLADNDYTKFMLDSNIHKVDYEQSLGQCYLLQSLIHIAEMFEDTFNVIFDLNGKPLITYTYHNNLYIPRCTNISTVQLINSSTCFADYPVIIIQNTTNTTAFLTRTGILRKSSANGKCNNKWIESNIQNKYLIRMKNGQSDVQPLDVSSLYTLQSHEND